MIRAFVIALAACLAALAWQTRRVHVLQIDAAEQATRLADAQARAERAARTTNTSLVDVMFNVDDAYQKGLTDAQVAANRHIAALNAGTLKLRREWAGCETGRLADSAAAARELGDAERSRRESAARIVRAADACDAQVDALIAAYAGVRATINAGPRP